MRLEEVERLQRCVGDAVEAGPLARRELLRSNSATRVSGDDGAVCVPFMYHHANPFVAPFGKNPTQS